MPSVLAAEELTMKFKVHFIAICAAALLPLGVVAAEAAAEKPAEKQESPAKQEKAVKKSCDSTTGSRLKSSRSCTPSTSATRTYSAEQLQDTGKMETAEALRTLDPTVR
jgi:hypothetical protein